MFMKAGRGGFGDDMRNVPALYKSQGPSIITVLSPID